MTSHFPDPVFSVRLSSPVSLKSLKLTHSYIVWHVDDAIDNNTNENHPKVGLIQADGLNQLGIKIAGRGDPGDPFPGSSVNTSFTSTSNPNSKSYAGKDTLVSITNISAPYQDMTMDVSIAA